MRYLILSLVIIGFSCHKKNEDRIVHIRGKRQHIVDVGYGKPVVVFVSGFGDRVSSWAKVQPSVAKVTQTISYDRAGLGESESLSDNRSLDTLIFELNELLEAEDIQPPYILVGHSLGGHVIRYFAHKHPDRVAALVLVDATVELLADEFRRVKSPAEIKSYDSLSKYGKDPTWPDGVRKEADYFEANNNAMKTIRFRDDIPATVITATKLQQSSFKFLEGTHEMKIALHNRWVSESPHLKHVFAELSGHYVQFDQPQLVIDEIIALVKLSR